MRPEQKEEFNRNVGKLFAEMKRKLNLKTTPKLFLADNKSNADKQLGGTGHYDPKTKTIKVYITDRHPKDILRSFAHEVVHHWQNENGKLTEPVASSQPEQLDPQYAQNDPNLRNMEKQAYLLGNIMLRDWEDIVKNQ